MGRVDLVERHGTRCTGGWVGPRAGVEVCGKSHLYTNSIPGPSSQYSRRTDSPIPAV